MKKQLKILLLGYMIYYIIYFYFVLIESDKWGNILSPIVVLIPSVILFNIAKKQKSVHEEYMFWMLLGLASFSWFLADFFWASYYFFEIGDPEESSLISILYMGTNLSLLVATIVYTFKRFKKWHIVQLIVDSVAVSSFVILLLWIVFFERSYSFFNLIINDGAITFLSVLFDILNVTLISILFLSIRNGKISIHIRWIMIAILTYCIVDLVWFYTYLNNLYTPNSIIDGVYLLPFVIIAIMSLFDNREKEFQSINNYSISNLGLDKKVFFTLTCPIIAIIFEGLSIKNVLGFFIIIVIYKSANTYIHYSVKNEELLKKEIQLNIELESKIHQRTEELMIKNKMLDTLSKKDPVTDIYNRRYFIEKLEEEINGIEKIDKNEQIAVLFIDLDKFKAINDLYGHNTGDKVLMKIGERLNNINPSQTLVARFGGDEFIMYYKGGGGQEELQFLIEQVIHSFSFPIIIGQYSFNPTASIGVAVYPKDTLKAEDMINHADVAMYHAKKNGRNKATMYSSHLSSEIRRASKIEYYLHTIDFDQEFELYYQPKFNIQTEEVVGIEALLRWNHEKLGMISPAEFIPIAEETDLIIDIGTWVVRSAIRQISNWNHKYNMELKMGINISPKQLDQKDLIQQMHQLFHVYSVRPSWIDLEITENIAMSDKKRMFEISKQFKPYGLTISIDDFGTGYSSLSYLKSFPFDTIKISKPLIDNLSTSKKDYYITKFIIQLAKSMEVQTIAEGVETKEQLEILKELGCDEIQGYLLGRPMPSCNFEELIQIQWSKAQ